LKPEERAMGKKDEMVNEAKQVRAGQHLTDVEYEILSYRLYALVNEARQAIMRVSGSPVVAEGGEALFAIYNTEGLTATLACGLLLHIIGTQGFIEEILDVQSEHPGINDGDIFMYNEPSIGGIHACDQWLGAPIFRDGKLVAWLGALTHTAETGAIEPGGMPPSSRSLLHEGYRVQGIKVQEKGYLNKAALNCVLRSSRDPAYYMLDMHAKIAGLNVGKERLLKIMDQYGTAKILAVMERNMEYSEKLARAKLRELADGTWRSALYGDAEGNDLKKLWKINVAMTKHGDELSIDFSGSSDANVGPVNCMRPGTIGSIFVAIVSQLFWEVPWNYGMWKPINIVLPENTLVNASFMTPCCMCPPIPGTSISAAVGSLIGKMYFTNEKYWKDINASWRGGCSVSLLYGGITQYGYRTGTMFSESWGSGTGAGIDRDGVDTGGLMMTVESCIADVEMSEMQNPFLYLWRREGVDTGGAARWRGGSGVSFSVMAHHNSPQLELGWLGQGKETSGVTSSCGGYPIGSYYPVICKNTGIKDRMARGEAKPDSVDELLKLPGDCKPYMAMVSTQPIKDGDIYAFDGAHGGGGMGDPLDREPERVLMDVKNRCHSVEMARKVYGVVIDARTLKVNEKATKRQREKIIEDRKRRGKVWGGEV
jgi:N-methylhydantoinase B